jgi:dolichyl-phosphate-mannose--protein O-mannosyl transferase
MLSQANGPSTSPYGYLHSHPHMYPTGSKQQQITLYPHKDENNVFVLELGIQMRHLQEHLA